MPVKDRKHPHTLSPFIGSVTSVILSKVIELSDINNQNGQTIGDAESEPTLSIGSKMGGRF
jgi:hypothetical protein